jgi:two-component system NarL family sensor kinase
LRVVVADDGCGFDMKSVEGKGEGLRNMRERMRVVGGTLIMESEEGEGTRLIYEVPV